jgi:Ca-activated chloride channel family protein
MFDFLGDSFNGFYFEYPLFGLIMILFLVCAYFCKMRMSGIYFPHINSFANEAVSQSTLLIMIKWFAIILLVVSLMSPVKDTQIQTQPDEGYDIALILDASQSMAARGFDPQNPVATRFDVVKYIVKDFVKERVNDNLGIVVFGKYSFVASPLTYDQKILGTIVDQLYIAMAGKFTALYEAVAQSVNLLKDAKAKSKIAILLTDGHNTGGEIAIDVAIDLAKKEGVKVYAIGIGGPNEYNAAILNQIANETGGKAFGARNASQLKSIYAEIDILEKSEIEHETFTYKTYYYHFSLFMGMFLLFAFVFMRNMQSVKN